MFNNVAYLKTTYSTTTFLFEVNTERDSGSVTCPLQPGPLISSCYNRLSDVQMMWHEQTANLGAQHGYVSHGTEDRQIISKGDTQ
jgi:hypothetical protein